jgi:hypothetical protein
MDPGEAAMFLAIGFVPTLIALELAYRMVRVIATRGEISLLVHRSKNNNNKSKLKSMISV